MESRSRPGAKVATPRLRRPNQQTVLPKPPRIRSETVDKACNRCRKRKTKCSRTRPRCINGGMQDLKCSYDEKRSNRLKEFINLIIIIYTLTTLLNGVSVDLETSRKRIKDALKDFKDDTPLTPSVLIKLISKRLRRALYFYK
ncbi:hypothetical protein COCVIDRAFT_114993 [Bipolaris victoriae FI3]|uniref:Zn(2)-C6 fungal-type domain-containing protein n=1 Tax=Bipolaris victoriae (strain FI3) TaxID=930091 RepID=W7E4Y6_BIPV3|nr:hypothetical protein COCVIDRAFT_114993 [Bipolaris victoriae FI3]